MQIGIDVKCMHTDFGGRGLSSFGDKISLWSIKVEKFHRSESAKKIHASRDQCHVHVHQFWWVWSLWFRRYGYLSKTTKFPFQGMDYSPWSSKNLIDRNQLKKLQVGVDVTCIHNSFGGRGPSGFGDMATFQKWPEFPFWGMDYSPWSSKNSIDQNRLKEFMQIGIDVKCMHTNFGGRGLSGFGDKFAYGP